MTMSRLSKELTTQPQINVSPEKEIVSMPGLDKDVTVFSIHQKKKKSLL